jgi:predicted  nucleic acid-binding Zn-ribbon protein
VKASPDDQLRLLDLQAKDLRLDQLAHRRRTRPELAEIEKLTASVSGFRDDLTRAETVVADLDRKVRRMESDVDQVRQRASRDQQRMDSGSVRNPKELESLQHEVATLARRQSELEDAALELMEEAESAQSVVAEATRRLAEATGSLADAERRRDQAHTEIDEQTGTLNAERGPLAAEIPDDLLALYERIRSTAGGIGAAMLRARRCEGCRLDLAGSDLAAVKAAAPDEVMRCEECRRILVRTAESGL